MFFRIKDIIEKRLENLGLAKKIEQEKRAIFIKKEIVKIYQTDPVKEIYFLNKETIMIVLENFIFLQDIQMRKDQLVGSVNSVFPKEQIKEIRIKIN